MMSKTLEAKEVRIYQRLWQHFREPSLVRFNLLIGGPFPVQNTDRLTQSPSPAV